MPDYLLHTNSSINREEFRQATAVDDECDLPRTILKGPLESERPSQILDGSSQIDLTDDEIISIEDTYRETMSKNGT